MTLTVLILKICEFLKNLNYNSMVLPLTPSHINFKNLLWDLFHFFALAKKKKFFSHLKLVTFEVLVFLYEIPLCIIFSMPTLNYQFSLLIPYISFYISSENLVLQQDIKQLLDKVEHDIVNYQNRGLCLIIQDIMRKPNSIIVLLYVFKQFAITFSSAGVKLRQNIGQSGGSSRFFSLKQSFRIFTLVFVVLLVFLESLFLIKTFNSSSETEANRSAIFSKVWQHYPDEGLGNY